MSLDSGQELADHEGQDQSEKEASSERKETERKGWFETNLDNGFDRFERSIISPFGRGLDNGVGLVSHNIIQPVNTAINKRLDTAMARVLRGIYRTVYSGKVTGQENFEGLEDKPTLIIANHISGLDAFALVAALPVRPAFAMSKTAYEELRKNPVYRFLFSRADIFPLDTDHPMAIKELTELAQSGQPVMIFPEGRTTRTGTLMKVMDGAALVAQKSGATIVPIHIDGFQYLTYAATVLKGYPKHLRSKVRVDIGKPRKLEIPEDLKGRAARRAAHDQLQAIMEELPLLSIDNSMTLMDELYKAAGIHGLDKTILTDTDRSISYKELLVGSYALGGKLSKITEEGENVGVLLPNSVGGSVTFWALQAYGRVPTMLNAKAETSDMVSYTETASLKTVLTSRVMVERMPGLAEKLKKLSETCKIVYLEDIKEKIGIKEKLVGLVQAGGLPLLPPMFRPKDQKRNGDDPAMVLFTSGSEALPKGVVLSSGNILNNIAQIRALTPFSPENDKLFNAMPMFHSFGMSGGMILPVLNGISSYQFPTPLEGKKIPLAAYDFDTTIMFGTNTFLNLYERYADGPDFSRVRLVFTGAEALNDDVYDHYVERFGVVPYQAYGMTEASPAVTMNVPGAHKKGTVGRFLPGIETRMEDVPGVEDGGKRLYIKGPNVMLGYLKHDKPGIIQAPENGWHDTGDIITVDDDGYVKLSGRAKRFAKIGGEMVSFDVVEQISRAASHDERAEHAVILGKDPNKGSEKIVLFTTDKEMDSSSLASAAKELEKSVLGLPKKQSIHIVDEIPHLPTGKTDYVRLSKLYNELAAKEAQEAKDTATEDITEDDVNKTPPAPPQNSSGTQEGPTPPAP